MGTGGGGESGPRTDSSEEADMEGRRPHPNAWFLALVVCGLLVSALIRGHIHPDFWWMGLPFVYLSALFLDNQVFRPWSLWRRIGAERIQLNREAEALGRSHFTGRPLPPFPLRALLGLLFIGWVFGPAVAEEGLLWGGRLAQAFQPARLVVHIEPPSFASSDAQTQVARPGEVLQLQILAGSFVQMTLSGGRGFEVLSEALLPEVSGRRDAAGEKPAVLEASPVPDGSTLSDTLSSTTDQNAWISPFSSNLMWSGSTELITTALERDPSATQKLALTVRTVSGDRFLLDTTIQPVPSPMVVLEHLGRPPDSRTQSQAMDGALFFSAAVESKVPLTNIELAVHTESGYSFNLPIGEFTGSDRLDFSTDSVQLQTAGIPFGEADVLYVKAVAHTVVPGLNGVSNEYRFPVTSPRESREKLIEQLEAVLDSLSSPQSSSFEMKESIVRQLEEAQKTARQLGNQSQAARQVAESLNLARKLDPKSKEQRDKLGSQIQDTLNALRRSNARDTASSWFLKTRDFLGKLAEADLSSEEQSLSSFASKSRELSQEAQDLKDQIESLIESPQSGLTLDEKLLAIEMLESDETPMRMEGVTDLIDQGERNEALEQGNETLTIATQSLGGILQLISVARSRVIREARERLTQADSDLETVRQSNDPAEQKSSASNAEKQLRETPELGNQFNDALEEAQDNAQRASRALQKGDQGQLQQSLDAAQQSIVQALAELQEEEQASREEQGEEEGRRYRSTMDAVSAQGQHDAGWRRRIFDTISRLREQGVPADASVIRYLESRLR
jgi:hypothetical protein